MTPFEDLVVQLGANFTTHVDYWEDSEGEPGPWGLVVRWTGAPYRAREAWQKLHREGMAPTRQIEVANVFGPSLGAAVALARTQPALAAALYLAEEIEDWTYDPEGDRYLPVLRGQAHPLGSHTRIPDKETRRVSDALSHHAKWLLRGSPSTGDGRGEAEDELTAAGVLACRVSGCAHERCVLDLTPLGRRVRLDLWLQDRAEESRGIYPADWPRCPSCGAPALDGHITCGDVRCEEGSWR